MCITHICTNTHTQPTSFFLPAWPQPQRQQLSIPCDPIYLPSWLHHPLTNSLNKFYEPSAAPGTVLTQCLVPWEAWWWAGALQRTRTPARRCTHTGQQSRESGARRGKAAWPQPWLLGDSLHTVCCFRVHHYSLTDLSHSPVSYSYYHHLFYRPENSSPEQLNNFPKTTMGLRGGTACSKEHRDLVGRISVHRDNLTWT